MENTFDVILEAEMKYFWRWISNLIF